MDTVSEDKILSLTVTSKIPDHIINHDNKRRVDLVAVYYTKLQKDEFDAYFIANELWAKEHHNIYIRTNEPPLLLFLVSRFVDIVKAYFPRGTGFAVYKGNLHTPLSNTQG